eukprot:5655024-Amphidinium_carterae.1
MRSGTTRTTLLQTELGQARRQASAQTTALRTELAQAQTSSVTPAERDRVHGEIQEMRTASRTLTEELRAAE